jgi:hypothetical protein
LPDRSWTFAKPPAGKERRVPASSSGLATLTATESPAATSTRTGPLVNLELWHRRQGRCEDRIRNAKDTGPRNLPLHGFEQNQILCHVVALAW